VILVDSCGWLEYLADGENAGAYAKALEKLNEVLVPTICILEVFKKVLQERGEGPALEVAALMQRGSVVELDATMAMNAAKFGSELGLPLADSVILATARVHKAPVWTQDAHFKDLPGVRFISA
jgi:predicted nucleic acid-binding protein